MQSQQDMDVLEVNKRLLAELEGMGFPLVQVARALHYSENDGIEAAVNWIIDHKNDPDIDPIPLIAENIDLDPPQPFETTEEMKIKAQELRNQACKKREDEERKLDQEREKERIRAGKEILGAKRIAEENEQKRDIALRKAEKEETKKAREKVRQRLEADKAERRLMLGLPSTSQNATKVPKPSTQGKRNYAPIMSVKKAEELRESLRSLKRNHKDDDAAVKRALQTLFIYVGNVAKNPDEEKFRKIRISNPVFQNRIGRLEGGIEFLELCGFERIQAGDKFLFLPRDKVDMAVLNSAGLELKSAITNPFFGLFSYG